MVENRETCRVQELHPSSLSPLLPPPPAFFFEFFRAPRSAVMLALLALLVPAGAVAVALPSGWRAYNDTNCVYSRLVDGPGKDSGDVHYLGTTPTIAACAALAHIGRHAPHGVNYHSLAWHGALPGDYHQQCYGVAGKEWLGTRQAGVTTLRGPEATQPPRPTPGPAPAPPGPCTDNAACNHNGKCAAGKCTCSPQFKGAAWQVLTHH